jgi:hypothetical protein
MKIIVHLLEKKSEILKQWFDLILETYPADTAHFLKRQKNRFDNPVGSTISEGIEGLFEELLQLIESDRVSLFLENIIRIRAIQDFTPSQALGFIFLLKKVIREELANEIREHQMFEELLTLESKIDDLANISFDIYVKYREKIYKMRAHELRNRTSRILKRTKMFKDIEAEEKGTAGF